MKNIAEMGDDKRRKFAAKLAVDIAGRLSVCANVDGQPIGATVAIVPGYAARGDEHLYLIARIGNPDLAPFIEGGQGEPVEECAGERNVDVKEMLDAARENIGRVQAWRVAASYDGVTVADHNGEETRNPHFDPAEWPEDEGRKGAE